MKIQSTVFAQLLQQLPLSHFEHLVDVHQANHGARGFTAHAHLVCLLYAQLTRRDGLRDLVACLNAQQGKLYHLGVRQRISRSTLADACERRASALFEDLAARLVQMALQVTAHEEQPLALQESLYALDSTTISLCMNLFPWAKFRRTSSAIKVHTAIELRAAIPVIVRITQARTADVRMLDEMVLPTGSIVVMDRAYVDYARLYASPRRIELCHPS
ncbi:MAG: IS4 family transposase [Brachymonas sp.]|nr:IS4 family transposase [Brachymonas sp.]